MVVAPVTVTGLVLGAGKAGRHLHTRARCRVARRGCRRARMRRQAAAQAAARCAGVAAALHMIERIGSREGPAPVIVDLFWPISDSTPDQRIGYRAAISAAG